MRRRVRRSVFLLIWTAGALLTVMLSACRPAVESPTSLPASPVTPAPSSAPTPASDEEAVAALIQAESEGVVRQDIDALMTLWLEEGVVVDARHTPEDASDDLTWRGWYAIRDRYITLVFPGNPSTAAPADLDIHIEGDRAVVTSTTQIGEEVSPAGDRWTFVRTPEGWRIESLTYNLEAQ